MKINYLPVVGMVALTACGIQEPQTELQPEQSVVMQSSVPIDGQYIVIYSGEIQGETRSKSVGDPAQSAAFVRQLSETVLETASVDRDAMTMVYHQSVSGFVVRMTEEQAAAVAADPRVAYVEQDRIITMAPPLTAKRKPGGGGGSTGQETPYGITRVGGSVNYTGSNVAWVIDTGIDLTHADLNVQTANGFTAFTSGRDANLNDGNGHGTHVAGTIAARNNTIGVVGVAAGAPVVPVKVLDSRGSGAYSGVIAGVDHVAARGKAGDVANMSLGGPVSPALDDAVLAAASKGIIFVIAAGNSSANSNNYSPARVNGANIYTISAMDSQNRFASFSNFANPPVDYCAPGVGIKSTWKGGGYNTISGTSMAAPHAAGVLLLGAPRTDGTVLNDRDSTPDPIIVR